MYDLQEIEAIKRLKHKYMRCVDEKRWDELRECFTEDATCAYSGGKHSFNGRDEIMDFLVGAMDKNTFMSCHRICQPEIDITSETTATGIWALEDYVIEEEYEIALHGAAFYRDEYIKVDGEWKIKHTGYKRTFEQVESRKGNDRVKITQRLSDS
ncbi:MAG: nuclear transport factor 2 family protein [Dehalococcoidia bacterium]